MARAGMPIRAASANRSFTRAAPSSIEYSVWTCRWVKLSGTSPPVSRHRVAQVGQVYADLMGAPGLQRDLQQVDGGEAFQHLPVGDRPAPRLGGHDRHALAVARVAAERCVDGAGGRRMALGERQVA